MERKKLPNTIIFVLSNYYTNKVRKMQAKRKGDEKNMSLEKPAYRDNLERIISAFPNQELLSKKEVADFCGLHSKTVGKMFPFKGNYISVATLARELS